MCDSVVGYIFFDIKKHMDPMQVALTNADLERLAQMPDTEVIVNHIREPWDPARVRACICEISGAVERDEPIPAGAEIRSFEDTHPHFYELAKSKDIHVRNFLHTMLAMKIAANEGTISHEEAAINVLNGIRDKGCTGH